MVVVVVEAVLKKRALDGVPIWSTAVDLMWDRMAALTLVVVEEVAHTTILLVMKLTMCLGGIIEVQVQKLIITDTRVTDGEVALLRPEILMILHVELCRVDAVVARTIAMAWHTEILMVRHHRGGVEVPILWFVLNKRTGATSSAHPTKQLKFVVKLWTGLEVADRRVFPSWGNRRRNINFFG